jgi:hypothetical protein
MVLARIATGALVALLLGEAAAQLPPMPDDKRYPELVAMKTWLESGIPQARHCAVSAGLFSEASEFYRATRSEPQTLEELRRRHEPTVPARDRAQLQSTLGHVVGMAAGFATLAEDIAPIAYSQLCIGRAKNPKAELAPAAIQARFNATAKCEVAHAAGSLDRKECVAVAFRL